jgi:hypothetical protein
MEMGVGGRKGRKRRESGSGRRGKDVRKRERVGGGRWGDCILPQPPPTHEAESSRVLIPQIRIPYTYPISHDLPVAIVGSALLVQMSKCSNFTACIQKERNAM